MKTAEEYLDQFIALERPETTERSRKVLRTGFAGSTYKAALQAMHAYALLVVEEDRKDAAKNANAVRVDEGIDYFDKESITDRPLPDLK